MPESKSASVNLGKWLDKADPLMEEYGKQLTALEETRAVLEEALANIRSDFEPEIREGESAIAALRDKLESLATTYKDEFPSTDLRSYVHAGVRMGFRESPPRVHIRRNFAAIALTWLLQTFGEGGFVRVKREINKEAVRDELMRPGSCDSRRLATRIEDFRARGITLKQEDKFFIELERAE